MKQSYFISGIGTGIGKTVVSAILAEVLEADYWKPVQAGFEDGTDSEWIQSVISGGKKRIVDELYKFRLPASSHIAAREEGVIISLEKIRHRYAELITEGRQLIIEGAGGLMVPLNEKEFVLDLIKMLGCKVILVSRNYLGSINHSLLTAQLCASKNVPVAGWVFNDRFMDYEEEIVRWSGYPLICSIPHLVKNDHEEITKITTGLRRQILHVL